MHGIKDRRENVIKKTIHTITHCTPNKIKLFLWDAYILSKRMEEAFYKVYGPCAICTSSGRLRQYNNSSLSHMNAASTEEIQAEYTVVYIKEVE